MWLGVETMINLLRFAPISLFVFKRPEHTRRTLESLEKNPEFAASPLFIFCDDARNATEAGQVESTRKLVRDWPHPHKTVIERDRNWGLANSIIAGVTELCERYGRVIVVEDDLVVSPVFLSYMNAALDRYLDDKEVMQVSGYMFPIENLQKPNEALFLPFTTSWGWGTWQRAWRNFDEYATGWEQMQQDVSLRRKFNIGGTLNYYEMLCQQITGKIDSWAIRWYWSVFKMQGLTLFPPTTLVENIGFDGSGTHGGRFGRRIAAGKMEIKNMPSFPASIIVNDCNVQQIATFWAGQRSILTSALKLFRRVFEIPFRAAGIVAGKKSSTG